jgi:pyruvate,water dikinase
MLFLNLGKEFLTKGIINSVEDIFFLNVNEINNILQDIKAGKVNSCIPVVIDRKKEMDTSRDYILPSVIYGEHAPIIETGKIRNHTGVGTSAGTYQGRTIVVTGSNDFDNVVKGDVVIIPFSDVSWTPILSIAGAIVSETGGLLSHCSIIAREMGIPALASVDNACSIGSGVNVTVDGSNGILTVHGYE